MDLLIRQEKPEDYKAVFLLVKKAFESDEFSDHKEHILIEHLRESTTFIPELSIVAEQKNKIVGHILLTKVKIKNNRNEFESLALAPVSVLPKYQGKGIGGLLIKQAHLKAKKLGYRSIILLGHANYYPRFGYQLAHEFGIELPFDVPKENCMAIEITKNGLKGVQGMVEYPKEFYL